MHFFWINFFGSTGWDVDASDANFWFLNLVQNFNERGKPPGTEVVNKSPCAEDNFAIFTTSILEDKNKQNSKCYTVNNFFLKSPFKKVLQQKTKIWRYFWQEFKHQSILNLLWCQIQYSLTSKFKQESDFSIRIYIFSAMFEWHRFVTVLLW